MSQARPTFTEAVVKTIVTHTVTYFIMGLLASTIFDYARFFAESSLNLMMRQTNDPWVMMGPLFQPIRGILFGIVFYLLREPFFGKKSGWLVMWIVLVVVGIIGTFGPTPGSLEGMLFTVFPLLSVTFCDPGSSLLVTHLCHPFLGTPSVPICQGSL